MVDVVVVEVVRVVVDASVELKSSVVNAFVQVVSALAPVVLVVSVVSVMLDTKLK